MILFWCQLRNLNLNLLFRYELLIFCPFLFYVHRWKSLTRSPSILKKDKRVDVIQDLKFFKALASPKVSNTFTDLFQFCAT